MSSRDTEYWNNWRKEYMRRWRKENPEKYEENKRLAREKRRIMNIENPSAAAELRKINAEKAAEWRKKNPEKARALYEAQKAWRKANPEEAREKQRKWINENRDRVNAHSAACLARHREEYRERRLNAYRTRPDYRQKRIAAARKWAIENPGKCNEIRAQRHALKLMATPSWVDRDAVADIYILSRTLQQMTGIKYHVDHYYPLKHKKLCGLHVPWNLRPLPGSENCSKSNKVTPEMLNPVKYNPEEHRSPSELLQDPHPSAAPGVPQEG